MDAGMKCVIVGDAPYVDDYIAELKGCAGPNVIFPGYIFGDGYWELNSHAAAYVFPSQASGMHPALLEALACGNCTIVADTPTNLETVGDAAIPYEHRCGAAALVEQLRAVLAEPEVRVAWGARARAHIATRYSWERTTDDYEALFARLLARGVSGEVAR
jgi:glycosyltransferase involved in cell wall biosynthesis